MARKNKKGKAKARSRKHHNQVGRQVRLVGSGDYSYASPGPWGKAGRQYGELGGAAAGKMAGNYIMPGAGGKVGGVLGGLAGKYAGGLLHYIGKLFGSGDYYGDTSGFVVNSLFKAGSGMHQAPSFSGGHHPVEIVRREYVGDIYSSVLDKVAFEIPLSPGDPKFVPWISSVGQHFQNAIFKGCVIEILSEYSEMGGGSPAMGYVGLGTRYDSVLPAPTNKRELLALDGAQSTKPSRSQLHGIECARGDNVLDWLYVEPATGIPAGADPRLYRLGSTTVMTGGQQADGLKMGELWITTHIEFTKPRLPIDSASQVAAYSFMRTSGITAPSFFGTSGNEPVIVTTNEPLIVADSENYMALPRPLQGGTDRKFLVIANANTTGGWSAGWGLSVDAAGGSFGEGVTLDPIWNTDGGTPATYLLSPRTTAATSSMTIICLATVSSVSSGVGASLQYTFSGANGTPGTGEVLVLETDITADAELDSIDVSELFDRLRQLEKEVDSTAWAMVRDRITA